MGHATSPQLLLLHSPPLVSSIRATSTPVQLYQHSSPPSTVTSHGAFVSLHPAGVSAGSAAFESTAHTGRPSAFTSVGLSSSSTFSPQHAPQSSSVAGATPLSPFALPTSSGALVAPAALSVCSSSRRRSSP